MLDDITEFLGADKRRTLMVGDTTHDLQMAQNAGTWGAGVSYGAHPVEALRDCAPLACFDSFAEFDTWLTPRLAN
jgi:phosphoglycolate phosphatase